MTNEEIFKEIERCYNRLRDSGVKQDDKILNDRIEKAKKFFASFIDPINLNRNASRPFRLYIAPVKEIKGANMTTCTTSDNSKEIYIDRQFMIENLEITKIQLTHEVLHGLSNHNKYGNQQFFGHEYDGSGKSLFTGIDEATTQMFTEDIEHVRLSAKEDYLYHIKNIMRVMKGIYGIKAIANQYFANSNDFEYYFSRVPHFNFLYFVNLMNEVYLLLKNNRYRSLSQEQLKELNDKLDELYSYVSKFVLQISQSYPEVIKDIIDEVNDDIILNNLGIGSRNKTGIQHK